METLYFANITLVKCETTIRVCKLYYQITRIIIVANLVQIVFIIIIITTNKFIF